MKEKGRYDELERKKGKMVVLWANHATKSIYSGSGRLCEVVRDKGEGFKKEKNGVWCGIVLEASKRRIKKEEKGGEEEG